MDMSIIATNTKRIIADRGYKQCAIAKKAGYEVKVFNNLLNGRKVIKAFDVAAIANALDVTPNELFAVSELQEGE